MIQQSGVPVNRLAELRVDYPSLKVVREHVSNGYARMLVISLPDSRGRTTHGEYKIVVDAGDLNQVTVSYLLNREDVQRCRYLREGGHSLAHYDQSQATIPGTDKKAWWICHGNFGSVYSNLEADPVVRIGAFLNHIISLLNG